MFAHRTATGLTLALLALPATATAGPLAAEAPRPAPSPPYTNYYDDAGGGESDAQVPRTWSGTDVPLRSMVSPDAADAARAGDIAKAMEHYERSQPAPAAAKPASHTGDDPAWPEIAFAGIVVLATAGGLVRVRMPRTRRIAA
jgi:hypothetical protein